MIKELILTYQGKFCSCGKEIHVKLNVTIGKDELTSITLNCFHCAKVEQQLLSNIKIMLEEVFFTGESPKTGEQNGTNSP